MLLIKLSNSTYMTNIYLEMNLHSVESYFYFHVLNLFPDYCILVAALHDTQNSEQLLFIQRMVEPERDPNNGRTPKRSWMITVLIS